MIIDAAGAESPVFVDASHPEQDRRFPAELRRLVERRNSEPDHRWLYRILAPFRIVAPERPTARTAYWWRSFPEGVLAEVCEIDAMSEKAGLSDEGNAAMRRKLCGHRKTVLRLALVT